MRSVAFLVFIAVAVAPVRAFCVATSARTVARLSCRARVVVQQEVPATFDTVVPSDSSAGSEVTVTTPDGQNMVVAVPEGLEPGDAFRVAYTPAPRAAPENYDEAEARGLELAASGEYERAIRMFELAQTLPGAGVDYNRQKQGGMIGSATAPPNPREWGETRYATPEQKLIAQYNIACCSAAMGDTRRAIELLRDYLSKVSEPLKQVNQMLVDDDLVGLRDQLQVLRQEYKVGSQKPGLFGLPGLRNPLREAAESIGVEWKD